MSQFKLKESKNRELLGGDLLAQALAHLGVDVAFGLHGGHLDAFLVGCELVGIRLIDTRHETVAVQAAEGYAKLSGKVGLCFVTANSGFCNGIPGLATAFADRSPIFCVTSSPPLRDAETNCLQGFHDQVVLAKPITKFAHRITNVEEIPRIVSYAFRTAHSGTPGPVLLDFPIDVLFSPPRLDAVAWGALSAPPAFPPNLNPYAGKQLLDLWKAAKRPVIITGTGAGGASEADGGAKNLVLELAEATSTPVFHTSKFGSQIPHGNTLRCGPATLLAVLPYIGQQRPDLVLLIGARTSFLLGGRGGAVIPKEDCKLVQVDLDGAEIGRFLPVELGIVSDATLFARSMLDIIKESPIPAHDEWIKTASGLKSLPSPYEQEPKIVESDGLLHPYHALKTVFTSLPPSSIIVVDGGEAGVWAGDLMEHAKASHSLGATGYLGFLGNGWGYSLGAAVARPDKLVVNIHGDGSAGFHIQELDTYARHGINILTVIMNNYFWGMSVAGQDIMYGTDEPARPTVALSPKCRFEVVAEGFNCRGAKIEKFEDVEKTVKELTSQKGPALINLIISRQPVTMTTRAMVGKPETKDENVIVVPYYDNVPRPFYKA